jgi:hypothetical protein
MLQDLANVTTIILGISTGIAYLLRRLDDRTIAQTAQRASMLLGVLFVVCLLGAFGASLASTVATSTSKADGPKGKSTLPTRGVDELRPAIKRAFLRRPLDENGWDISPTELNHYVFDLSKSEPAIIMNLSFMDQLKMNVVSAGADSLRCELRGDPQQEWQLLRRQNSLGINSTDTALEIQRMPRYQAEPLSHPGSKVAFHILASPPKDAVVIGTQSELPEGKLTLWGPVFTELEDCRLSWECRVLFFGREGKHRPETDFSKHPPKVRFIRSPTAQPSASDHGTDCYSWKQTFTSESQGVEDGKTLAIEIPAGLGDSVVWVSFPIGLAAEKR